ncbi:MAG: hypothetical protein A2787_08650 [Omnitrophica WOR_2 bacterium RIFCSPHIGHO2_01_FULL_48_9]|nr:MAG: hypothetical protein A3D10_07865 [Omnitrophica WOR_2 bacterium RIFCSPHIGHO2_02_FULL_48_11]OGX32718.1 MAG: hypothetical protein A2787_08650 [Omnitrophica WOR_2 bacterium RIFCSPHIGHO2_01_FULL_48_9]
MLLAIDIGNTTIALGLIVRKKVLRVFHIETVLPQNVLRKKIRTTCLALARQSPKLKGIVICSVVPQRLALVQSTVEKIFGIKPVVIGKDVLVPVKNRYRNPKQVGQDRLVGAYAAMVLYGAPSIIIDFGTAITFDVISSKKEYLGGIIVPGIRLSAESLFAKTALLPKIHIKGPKNLIGRDTQGSILSGLFYGYGAMSSGLVEQISREVRGNPKVIVTGGYIKVMQKFLKGTRHIVDEDLVFKGMELIFHKR